MPELRTALLLAGGLGVVVDDRREFLGFPTGLGFMAASAVQETNTARLVIVAIVVAFYSLLTFYLLNQMFNRMVSWMRNVPVARPTSRRWRAPPALPAAPKPNSTNSPKRQRNSPRQ